LLSYFISCLNFLNLFSFILIFLWLCCWIFFVNLTNRWHFEKNGLFWLFYFYLKLFRINSLYVLLFYFLRRIILLWILFLYFFIRPANLFYCFCGFYLILNRRLLNLLIYWIITIWESLLFFFSILFFLTFLFAWYYLFFFLFFIIVWFKLRVSPSRSTISLLINVRSNV
jgi:hypothetical protein